jgi:hypothetical protein
VIAEASTVEQASSYSAAWSFSLCSLPSSPMRESYATSTGEGSSAPLHLMGTAARNQSSLTIGSITRSLNIPTVSLTCSGGRKDD